ncbi:MAG: chorismate synthase [Alphaproteobacteria bacterium RIFCSPLOWO2_01_FULL_40_26]|nr:MAG: chorismate synthase [Alphaproteobacteria bacterium RIFCSPHIGHO2_02_FULL_40_34]OFW87556.1 MAG: chorismate synthase [Alphaproteobacteria bacterium RIFCSPHIGHO2_01_FULL_40_8]OFW94486.1 MAG: chorismate synthase [Alphaproteobacteria bacterium RIFCSPLOWO2_01_FULL_40_26]OFX10197.1 MAG: chorismate synthase [Alphaproteobacteria bacterium RIFCSPLOWO2_02_FULL_40_19]OFX11220.1 MAG: chorismate synthase [Alphaproteobacteria bacterium RIFCSPLOWO2_12_FULL_40_11]
MSNKFGEIFSFTSWGESHGEAIGCVVDGCPSLIELNDSDIQKHLDRRRPGQSKFTTKRQEKDQVKILSGVFEGKTTGTPIGMIIFNEDQKSGDYSEIKDKFRPSHADYTYFKKYGIRDYRGGGRSSARETAMRVAAGAIARKILEREKIEITGYLTQIGEKKIDRTKIDFSEIKKNDFFCPDKEAAKNFEDYLLEIRKSGNSVGAIIEVIARNVPLGLGEPIYNKLDSRLAQAMMSINAVKAVEIGDGMAVASKCGSELADEMRNENDKIIFSNNHSGGILGGISSGQDIVLRFAVKPTSSILIPRKTVDVHGNNTEIITKGRHDPCVGIRAVPIGEAMMACVLADFLLLQKARN